MTPEISVAEWLSDLGGGTYGLDIFAGPPAVRGDLIQDDAVFVMATGGPAPQESLGRGSSLWHPTVQVISRGSEPYVQSTARSLAEAVVVGAPSPPTGYLAVDLLDSDPVLIEEDDRGLSYYVFNLRLTATR